MPRLGPKAPTCETSFTDSRRAVGISVPRWRSAIRSWYPSITCSPTTSPTTIPATSTWIQESLDPQLGSSTGTLGLLRHTGAPAKSGIGQIDFHDSVQGDIISKFQHAAYVAAYRAVSRLI